MRVDLHGRQGRLGFALTPELISLGKQKKFKKNQIVYNKGDKTQGVYYVESGFLGLVNLTQSGGETLLRVFGKNEFTGHRSFFSEENYHATCVALSDVTLLYFPFDNPRACLEKNSDLFFHMLKGMACDLRVAEERLNDFSGKKVSARIIEGILFLKLRYPGHIWTRREIGEFCVAKTETVTRVLTKLESKGLIEKRGRDILIPDQEALLRYSENLALD